MPKPQVRKENNHPPNPAQTTTQLATAQMRKRARDESTSIYDDQLEAHSQEQNSTDVLKAMCLVISLIFVVNFMDVDFLIVDFMKSCFYKN